MKKKNILFGTAIAMMLGTVVGCSISVDQQKQEGSKEEKNEMSDQDYMKKYGQAEQPLFVVISENEIPDKEKEALKIYEKATGINIPSEIDENYRILVPKEGKLRYITETQEDNIVKVYLRKVDDREEGIKFFLGKVTDPTKEYWFYDAETELPIQLDDLEREVSKESGEIAEAITVETDDQNASGEPVIIEMPESEKVADEKEKSKSVFKEQ